MKCPRRRPTLAPLPHCLEANAPAARENKVSNARQGGRRCCRDDELVRDGDLYTSIALDRDSRHSESKRLREVCDLETIAMRNKALVPSGTRAMTATVCP